MRQPCRAVLAFIAFAPTSASAQVSTWADLATTWVESEVAGETSGLTFAPTLLYQPATGASLTMGGAYGRYSDGLWALQGVVDATVTPRPIGRFGPELSLSGSVLADRDGGPADILALARARLHRAGSRAGLWGGGGGGGADDGGAARGVVFADLGGWFTVGPATIAGSLLPTSVDPGGRYLDAELGLRAGWRRLELAAGVGRRWWRGDSLAGESWASVGLELGVLPGLALTAAAGHFPADPIRGYLEGGYVQFGARIGRRPGYGPEGWALRQAYRTRPPIAAPVVRGFEVRTELAVRHFLVDAPGAARVELAGDFTDWEPIALEPWEDGTWRVERVVEPGSYRFNLRVDGGPWGAPPGVVTVRDEYGGVAAVLILE